MNIPILVTNKVAMAPEGTVIVCGNSDYTLTFNFDSEWQEEPNRVARFTYRKGGSAYYKDVAFTGDTVSAPVLSGIRMISVGVYAGELRTTTPAMIPCTPSILCVSATHDKTDEMMWPSLEQRVAVLEQGGVSEEQIANVVEKYLAEHPIAPGVDEQEVRGIITAYLNENPAITDEQLAEAIAAYFDEHPIEIPDSGQNVAQDFILLKSPNGVEWKVTVSDGGDVTAVRADGGETVRFSLPVVRLTGDIGNISSEQYENVLCHFLDKESGVEFSDYAKIAFQGSGSLNYSKVTDGVDTAKNYKIKLFTDEARETKSKRQFKDWHATNNYHIKANYAECTNFMNNMMMHFLSKSYQYLTPLPREGARYVVDGFAVLLYINDVFCGIRYWNLKQDDKVYNLNEEERDEEGNITQTADYCYQIGLNNGTNSGDNSGAFVYGNLDSGSNAGKGFADAHTEIDHYWEDRVWDQKGNHPDVLYNTVKWVSEATDAEFRANLHKHFDVDYLIHYFVCMYTCCMIDSKGKNFNMIFLPEKGVWYPTFWDMDYAFGNYYNCDRTGAMTDIDVFGLRTSRLFDKLWRNFRAECIAHYWELRETLFTVKQVEDSIDSVWGFIPAEWIEANKVAKYDGTNYTFYENGAEVVLEWAAERFPWMDTKMVESDDVIDWTTIPTESITLSANELTISADGEFQMLTATVTPSDTTDIVLWTTSNNTVARVVDGKVIAVGAGTATVTATSGDHHATCTITVAGTNDVSLVYALPEETQFGDTTVIDTGIKLFDAPKDWTIVVDADLTQETNGLRTVFHCAAPAADREYGIRLVRELSVTDGTTGMYAFRGKCDTTVIPTNDLYRTVPATASKFAIVCKAGVVTSIRYIYNGEVVDHVPSGNIYRQVDASLVLGKNLTAAFPTNWRGLMRKFEVYSGVLTEEQIVERLA